MSRPPMPYWLRALQLPRARWRWLELLEQEPELEPPEVSAARSGRTVRVSKAQPGLPVWRTPEEEAAEQARRAAKLLRLQRRASRRLPLFSSGETDNLSSAQQASTNDKPDSAEPAEDKHQADGGSYREFRDNLIRGALCDYFVLKWDRCP